MTKKKVGSYTHSFYALLACECVGIEIWSCKFCCCFVSFCPGRTRSAAGPQKRVLDDATRKRRQQRQLEALEKDNFHDDPHAIYAHLTVKAKLPTFADGSESELYGNCVWVRV